LDVKSIRKLVREVEQSARLTAGGGSFNEKDFMDAI
jgi:hypothetical protein